MRTPPPPEPERRGEVLVAGAALVDDVQRPRRLLGARRTAPPDLAGRWELPGGKVEAGEEPEQALRRELREELGIEVRLGAPVPGPDTAAWPLGSGRRMLLWWAQVRTGEAQPLQDHDALCWVSRSQLPSLDWLPSNTAITAYLAQRMHQG